MKAKKKQKEIFPEVHIHGDLQDVKYLIDGVNKKRTIVVFKDGEEGSFYLEIDGEIQKIITEEIPELEKDYRLIFFSFFPGLKKAAPVIEEQAEVPETVKEETLEEVKEEGKAEGMEEGKKKHKKEKKKEEKQKHKKERKTK